MWFEVNSSTVVLLELRQTEADSTHCIHAHSFNLFMQDQTGNCHTNTFEKILGDITPLSLMKDWSWKFIPFTESLENIGKIEVWRQLLHDVLLPLFLVLLRVGLRDSECFGWSKIWHWFNETSCVLYFFFYLKRRLAVEQFLLQQRTMKLTINCRALEVSKGLKLSLKGSFAANLGPGCAK